MAVVIQLIANFAWIIYILLALIALAWLRVLQVALRERSRSIFALERETARTKIRRSINVLLFIGLLAAGVFYTANFLIIQVPIPEVPPTPTPVSELPPTPTQPPLLPTPTSTPTPAPLITPTPFVVPNIAITPTPETVVVPQTSPPNCPIPGVSLTQPRNGAIVSGVVAITGAAFSENFNYYKLEFRIPGQEWNFILDDIFPNAGGQLGAWDTSTVPAGDYELRLVVVDNTGNYPTPCQVRINVQ